MTCTEIEELSGAYVLDAITPEEQQVLEEHLAQCPNCSRLIQELRSVVDLLPLTVPLVEPSPALKSRVLSAVQEQATRQTQATQRQSVVQPISKARRRSVWQRWGTPLLAAAAILMFVLFGATTAWNITLQQQLASVSTSAPVTYAIQGTSNGSAVTGQVTYFPKQHITVMVVRGLQQTQGSQVYQGWLLQGKQPTSIGLLNTQNGVATIDYAGDIKHFDVAAVSLEPGPSASQNAPKGQVVAVSTLHNTTQSS